MEEHTPISKLRLLEDQQERWMFYAHSDKIKQQREHLESVYARWNQQNFPRKCPRRLTYDHLRNSQACQNHINDNYWKSRRLPAKPGKLPSLSPKKQCPETKVLPRTLPVTVTKPSATADSIPLHHLKKVSFPKLKPLPNVQLRSPTIKECEPVREMDDYFCDLAERADLLKPFACAGDDPIESVKFYRDNYPLLMRNANTKDVYLPRRGQVPESVVLKRHLMQRRKKQIELGLALDDLEETWDDIFETFLRDDTFDPSTWPWNSDR